MASPRHGGFYPLTETNSLCPGVSRDDVEVREVRD